MAKLLSITFVLASLTLANDDEPSARIIGGSIARQNTYNYIVHLRIKSRKICRGSLIAKDTVITAGHCINGTIPGGYNIRGKVHNFRKDDEIRLQATKIILHPDYSRDRLDNDIALIKVNPNHSINSFLKLYTSNTAYINNKIFVAGWGRTKSDGTLSDVLKELDIKVIEPSIYLEKIDPINEKTHFCATGVELGFTTCKGDSGSPVIAKDLSTIIGIVSYGKGCDPSLAAFTRISNYIEWINKYSSIDSEQTSRPRFKDGANKSSRLTGGYYYLDKCTQAGDNVCFQKSIIGICYNNISPYPFNCPQGTSCKLNDGKMYCA